jgi:hypothetical protein
LQAVTPGAESTRSADESPISDDAENLTDVDFADLAAAFFRGLDEEEAGTEFERRS